DAKLLTEAGGEVRTQPRQHLIPPIEGGFVSVEAHPANGTLFPQPIVHRPGADVLLDEIAGSGLRVILGPALAPQSATIGKLADAVGASIVSFDAAGGLQ